MTGLVLAANRWATNAELIADVARLGYLRPDVLTLDPTYGDGKWWTEWQPSADMFCASDLYKGPLHYNFRAMPFPDGMFEQIAFDPPYVCPGGLKTSKTKVMHEAYGMNSGDAAGQRDFKTPAELQTIINDGLTEMRRLARARVSRGKAKHPGAVVLVKCKDYIWGGKLWLGTHLTLTHALGLGFTLEDRFEHVGEPGPQSQTSQHHARRNLSTLLVLRAPKAQREVLL